MLAGRSIDQHLNPWAGCPVDDAWHSRPPLARTLGSADSAASMAASLAGIDRELLYGGPPVLDRAAAGRACASYAPLGLQLTDGQTMVSLPQRHWHSRCAGAPNVCPGVLTSVPWGVVNK